MFLFDHPSFPVAKHAAATQAAEVIEKLKEFSSETVLDNPLIKATVQAAFLIAADEAGISGPAIQLQNFSDSEAQHAVYQEIHPFEDFKSDYIATGGDVHQTAWKIVPIARRLYPELSANELAQCPLVRNSVKAAILLLNKGRVSFGNEELMEVAEQAADEIISQTINTEFNKEEKLPDLSAAKEAAIQEAKDAVQLAQETYKWVRPQDLGRVPLVVGNVQRAYLEALQEHNIEIDHPILDAMKYHVADAIYTTLYPKS
jgi:hypothetical protein